MYVRWLCVALSHTKNICPNMFSPVHAQRSWGGGTAFGVAVGAGWSSGDDREGLRERPGEAPVVAGGI